MKQRTTIFILLLSIISLGHCFAESVLTESQIRKIRYQIEASCSYFEPEKGKWPICEKEEDAKEFIMNLPDFLSFTDGQKKRFLADINEDFDFVGAAIEVDNITIEIYESKMDRVAVINLFGAWLAGLAATADRIGAGLRRVAQEYMQEIPY